MTTVLPWSVKKEVSKGILIGARLSLDTVYSRHHHVRAPNTYSHTNTITRQRFPCYGSDWLQENMLDCKHGVSHGTKLHLNTFTVTVKKYLSWLCFHSNTTGNIYIHVILMFNPANNLLR
jgi:hypothetical protein